MSGLRSVKSNKVSAIVRICTVGPSTSFTASTSSASSHNISTKPALSSTTLTLKRSHLRVFHRSYNPFSTATARSDHRNWLIYTMARNSNFARSNSSSSSDGESTGRASRHSMSSSRAPVKASCYVVRNSTMALEGFHYTTSAPGVGW